MKLLTFLPLEEIQEMEKWEGSQLNKAKEILAFQLTELVHGTEEAKKAEAGAKALFAGGADQPSCKIRSCNNPFRGKKSHRAGRRFR